MNLNVAGIYHTKHLNYKEYHTSKDDLDFISAKGLMGGLQSMQEIILNLEINAVYKNTIICEPNLGKRGLYHTLSTINTPFFWCVISLPIAMVKTILLT